MRYEYATLYLPFKQPGLSRHAPEMVEFDTPMNEMIASGWEFVQMIAAGESLSVYVTFRKEKR